MRGAAWLAAAVLVVYGGVLTLIGLLVQADIVHAAAHANHKALRWHAFLWDPWFLVWGLLLATALALSRGPSADRLQHSLRVSASDAVSRSACGRGEIDQILVVCILGGPQYRIPRLSTLARDARAAREAA